MEQQSHVFAIFKLLCYDAKVNVVTIGYKRHVMMICCLRNMILITISDKIMKRSEIWDKCLHSSNQTNGQNLCFIESFFSCAFTYFLLVIGAHWPLLVISLSYIFTNC
jgi:hypothetical protein